MKKTAVFLASFLIFFSCQNDKTSDFDPTASVDPFIGTAGEGNVHPGALVPWGMVSVTPINTDYDRPGYFPFGYKYGSPFMYGFSHVNLSGVGCKDMGSIQIMPTTGVIKTEEQNYKSSYSDETATPGYYATTLDEYQIRAEMTATLRSGISRYSFPDNTGNLLLNLGTSTSDNRGSEIKLVSSTKLEGFKTDGNFCGQGTSHNVYFAIEINQEPSKSGTWEDNALSEARSISGNQTGAYFSFDNLKGHPLEVRVGVSYVSTKNAWENLEKEQNSKGFEAIRKEASDHWNSELGKIEVQGGTEKEKTNFYTALYHALIHPNVISDVNGEYPLMGDDPGFGTYSEGQKRYTVYSLWDTYRTIHPLLSLVYPERQLDMTRTMVDMYKENGWLPKWELAGSETYVMVGDPAAPVVADTYMKGLKDFDVETAMEAMIKGGSLADSVNPLRPGLKYYLEYGFLPDNQYEEWLWGSVATTLEYGIADYGIAQLAQALGREDVTRDFNRRSKFYKNLYDKETGLLRPRLMDSSFLEPFDPAAVNGELDWANSGGKGFVEGSSWQYTWFVPHDQQGLKELMGGDEIYTNKLQQCFDEGHFQLWNEPDMAYPYLFNYVKGEEWRTQRKVHEITQQYFNEFPFGIPGNDDTGTLSAWLVFSMMGIYPDCPGNPTYQLVTPAFEEVRIKLNADYYTGEELVITKNGVNHVFIDKINWNKEVHDSFQISHKQLTEGGRLSLTTKALPEDHDLKDRIAGMIYGTLIGDAAGGPPEFKYPPNRSELSKKSTSITKQDIATLKDRFELTSYRQYPGLYNIWEKDAPAGTVTDDSRWKLITINTIEKNENFGQSDFIEQLYAFEDSIPASYKGLNEKWMEQTYFSTKGKLPQDRMWAGVSTLLGQMVLSPMAALNPYDLQETYRHAWEANIFDQGSTKDINTAVIVGLAKALQKDSNWEGVKTAMRLTDPHHFDEVPFTSRRLNTYIDSVETFVNDSKRVVAHLFERLEKRTETREWWNAWLPMQVVFSTAAITDYDPLASMQLCIEFGHDTDSYAQLAGAYFGAMHGASIFPEEMKNTVRQRLIEDYNHDPEQLINVLYEAHQKKHVH
ncbi:MAG: GH92 family glycosyl hydrolase [Bacteroidota bacterium]